MTITRTGEPTEVRFRNLTGAQPAYAKRDGDAILDGHLVELKYASGGAVNQVRAAKYIPLVVQTPIAWFVLPPNEIVRLVLRKERGQHGENPFENAVLSVAQLSPWMTTETDLRQATLEAVAEGECWPAIRLEMRRMNTITRAVTDATRANVKTIFEIGPTAAARLPRATMQLQIPA